MDSVKNRNASIDLMRLLGALMVVAGHTSLLFDINENVGYVISNMLPRLVVPFFYCVMGYYYIGKLLRGENAFLSMVKRLLQGYLIWSIIYFIKELIEVILSKGDIIELIKTSIFLFFTKGSYFHLWFFPAAFFSIFVVTFLYKMKWMQYGVVAAVFCLLLGALGSSYYEIGNQIPIITKIVNSPNFVWIRCYFSSSFSFFMLGYVLQKTYVKDKTKHIEKKIIGCGLLYSFEIFTVNYTGVQRDIAISLSLAPCLYYLMIFLLNNPLPQYYKTAQYARKMANFIYYSHPLFIYMIATVGQNVFKISLTSSVLFLTTIVFLGVASYLIVKKNDKWFKLLYI